MVYRLIILGRLLFSLLLPTKGGRKGLRPLTRPWVLLSHWPYFDLTPALKIFQVLHHDGVSTLASRYQNFTGGGLLEMNLLM